MHKSKHKPPIVIGRGRNYFRGGPNDPSALRGELGSRFLAALKADFAHRGGRAIRSLRRKRLQDYLKLVITLLPKEYRIREVPLDEMPDDEFNALRDFVREALARHEGQGQQPGSSLAIANEVSRDTT
jgi:hypothetical protein